MKSGIKSRGRETFALAFGLFLGLALLKFGNPVILDGKITTPVSPAEFLEDPWPTHWANWALVPFLLFGVARVWFEKPPRPDARRLWLLPLLWFGWQLLSATRSVDPVLTIATLWQFFGCVGCYFLGTTLLGHEPARAWLLAGLLAAFAWCLVRAVDQRLFEFPQSHQMLVEGERTNWTNLPPETVRELKRESILISTNGADIANPALLAKFAKGRVNGTLVYPNALAGAVLLLWPVSLTLAFYHTGRLRPLIRAGVLLMVLLLGGAGFYWTGSKLAWLIAVAVGGAFLLRLPWPMRWKWLALTVVLSAGLGVFALRFHDYFASGATSAGARLDYWRAAVQTTVANPLWGTGPGTFQRPYARLKAPDAEMARLAHNDYLEQFSDSGMPGGIFYAAWIAVALFAAGQRLRRGNGDRLAIATFAGVLGWFVQGIGEFALYIPALAWTAFTLLGCLLYPIDKRSTAT